MYHIFVFRVEWMTLLLGREYFIILCTDVLILLLKQRHPDLKTVDVFGGGGTRRGVVVILLCITPETQVTVFTQSSEILTQIQQGGLPWSLAFSVLATISLANKVSWYSDIGQHHICKTGKCYKIWGASEVHFIRLPLRSPSLSMHACSRTWSWSVVHLLNISFNTNLL